MSDYQDKDYEDVCIICRRGESKAGRMFHLPGNITVCDDCMHMTMETVSHMDKSMFPNMNGMNMSAMDMQAFMNSLNGANTSKQPAEKSADISSSESEKDSEDIIKNPKETDSSQTPTELEDDESIEDVDDIDDDEDENDEPKKSHGNPFGFGGFPNISFVKKRSTSNFSGQRSIYTPSRMKILRITNT